MDEIIPFTSLLEIISGWSKRFDKENLLKQNIFQPYPKELILKEGSLKCYIQ